MTDSTHYGKIKWFSNSYGFITPSSGGNDVFLHISAVTSSGYTEVKEGQKISYNTETKNGKVSAVDIKILED